MPSKEPIQFQQQPANEQHSQNSQVTTNYNKTDPSCEFIIDDILLGCGSFSHVRLAQNSITNELVAAKMTDLSKNRIYYDKEVKALTSIPPHKNIISLIQYGEDGSTGYIFTEFAQESKTLFDYVKERVGGNREIRGLSELESLEILDQIVDGLEVIHNSKFSHNDLKPENILFNWSTKTAHIFDFGLSLDYTKTTKNSEFRTGTPLYMSPEILRGNESINPVFSDIWSLGLVFYFMLVGDLPWPQVSSLTKLIQIVHSGKLYFPKNFRISPESCRLLAGMLQLKPTARWPLKKIKENIRNLMMKIRCRLSNEPIISTESIISAALANAYNRF